MRKRNPVARVFRIAPVLFLLLTTGCPSDDLSPSLSIGGGEDSASNSEVVDRGETTSPDPIGADTEAEFDSTTDPPCLPSCKGKMCGVDGCGVSCGTCDPGLDCVEGMCAVACGSPGCALGMPCALPDGSAALCGGVIDCDHGPQGNPLPVNLDVENLFGQAGVLMHTPNPNSIVATNPWELESASGKQSCASLQGAQTYWQHHVTIRFVVPSADGYAQAATDYVSLYLGQTWNGGLKVQFYRPDSPPNVAGSTPFHVETPGGKPPNYLGTFFIQYQSAQPIGFVRIRKADDPDFTFDDLAFGTIVPQ